jgi:uncharacterized protein
VRRALAGAAVAAGAAAFWATVVEPRRLRIREVEVEVEGWPAALADMRIALIADLHAGAPQVDERRVAQVVDAVNRAHPDLVALLGDYVDPEVALGDPVEPEAVAARLGELEAPLGSFAVLGNHDWRNDGERVRRALREQLIDVLENDAASVDFAGQVIWIVGLADATMRAPDLSTPFSMVPASAPLLVLSHDPHVFPSLPDRPMLVVAGHTHGGQVNIPGVRELVKPSPFFGGLERAGRRVMYVSRGIGTSTLPIRFRAAPEVVVLTMRVAGSAR